MTPNRKSLWALGSLALIGIVADQLVKPIWDVETQDLWKDKVKPYLVAHASGWVAIMFDWLGLFWSGVALTLIALLIIEILHTVWRRFSQAGADEGKPSAAALIELGRECIAIADDVQADIARSDETAPRLIRPAGGFPSEAAFSEANHLHAKEQHIHQGRALRQRDRVHGAQIIDAMFRLRALGVEIPNFSDSKAPSVPDDAMALMVPYYMAAYARFVKVMGIWLKRGDLSGAKVAARHYRRATERGDMAEG